MPTKVAIVTGASRGLGLALARGLADRGWALVVDARGENALGEAAAELAARTTVLAIPGDIADAGHRRDLVAAAGRLGGLDAVVNNASLLGPSPQPLLADYPLDELRRVFEANVVGPLGLVQEALPSLRAVRFPRNLTRLPHYADVPERPTEFSDSARLAKRRS